MATYTNAYRYGTTEPCVECSLTFDARGDCLEDINDEADREYLGTFITEGSRTTFEDLEAEAWDAAAEACRNWANDKAEQAFQMWRKTG